MARDPRCSLPSGRLVLLVALLLPLLLSILQVDVVVLAIGEKRRRSQRLIERLSSEDGELPVAPSLRPQPLAPKAFPIEALPTSVLSYFANACPLASLQLAQVSKLYRGTVLTDTRLHDECIYRVAMDRYGDDILKVIKVFSLGGRESDDEQTVKDLYAALIPILRTYQRLGNSLDSDPFLLHQLTVALRQALLDQEWPVIEYLLREQSKPYLIPIGKLIETSIQEMKMEVFPKLIRYLPRSQRRSPQLKNRYLRMAFKTGSLFVVHRVFCEWQGVSTEDQWIKLHEQEELTPYQQTELVAQIVKNQFQWKDWYGDMVASSSQSDLLSLFLHFMPTMTSAALTRAYSLAVRDGNHDMVDILAARGVSMPEDMMEAAGASGSFEMVRRALQAKGPDDLEQAVRSAIHENHTPLVLMLLQASFFDTAANKLRFLPVFLTVYVRVSAEHLLTEKPYLVAYFGCDLALLLMTDTSISITVAEKFFSREFLANCGGDVPVEVARYGSQPAFEYALAALPVDAMGYAEVMTLLSEVVGNGIEIGKPYMVTALLAYMVESGLADDRYAQVPLRPRYGAFLLDEEDTRVEVPHDEMLHRSIRTFLAYAQFQMDQNVPLSAGDKEFLLLYAPSSIVRRYLPRVQSWTARDLDAAAKRCDSVTLRTLLTATTTTTTNRRRLPDEEIFQYFTASLGQPETRCLLGFRERIKEPLNAYFLRQSGPLLAMGEEEWLEEVNRWDRLVVKQIVRLLEDAKGEVMRVRERLVVYLGHRR